jgi:formylglycine-generating enzyme required for sulfatase activity
VRRWYVNGQGQTLVLVPGPVEFRMGAPAGERDRQDDEAPHRRRIPRGFALASKAVTQEEFLRFFADRRPVWVHYPYHYGPEPDAPILCVSWFVAAQYCNWLSEKEGLPETEWCYPKHADIKAGMTLPKDYLRRAGYRLPTEAEWEYAARAGTVTSRSYGTSLELLPRYAWYQDNAQEHAWPVGQKRPNDLGLFDVHGNVYTWCQDPAVLYPQQQDIMAFDDVEQTQVAGDLPKRTLRGGSFFDRQQDLRSPSRHVTFPRDDAVPFGLRVARTYPSPVRGGE